MEFRQATMDDLGDVLLIYDQAKSLLASRGIDQWQDGYPSQKSLINDIQCNQSYVALNEGAIVGTVALCLGLEPTYAQITGAWRQGGPYLSIHRFAVSEKCRGTGASDAMMEFALVTARRNALVSARSDTHQLNVPMAGLLRRHGFVECGIVYVDDHQQRIAYECLL